MDESPQQTQPTTDWQAASDVEIMNADLFVAMGLELLSDEEKVAMMDKMTETIQLAVAKRVMETLDETKQQELTQLMESHNDEGLGQFLETNVPDFEDLIEKEMVAFKRAMLTGNITPQA